MRYDEFKENWSLSKIKEISLINPTHNNLPNSFIYIDLESVKKGVLRKKNLISKKSAPSRAQRFLKRGDILYQSVRPYQKNNYFFDLDGDYVASTGYLQIKTTINNKYLYQYFHNNTFVNKVLKLCTGANYPTINSKDFGNIEIAIPSNSEQNKIAEFLSSVDKKIQLLENKKEQLELYKKGVMQKIFSQEIRFKDDNGNSYPDWEDKKLGEIGETFNGLTGKTKEDFGRGKPFIQYMQIFNSAKIDTSKFGYVDIKEGEKQKTAQYGDVFFTTSSEAPLEIGYASVLTEDIEELYLNSFCFGYRPNSLTELYPDFSSYLFRSKSLRKQIVKLAQGSTRYNMSKVQLMRVLIQLPSLEEQKKIASFLSSIDKKIDCVSVQIEKTKEFKKGLLQQMFV